MKNDFLRVLGFVRHRTFKYASGVILMTLSSSFISVIEAFTLKNIINAALARNMSMFYDLLIYIGIGFGLCIAGFPVFMWWYNYASQNTARDIKKIIFRHTMSLPLGYFEKRHGGDIMTRLTMDVDGIIGILTFRLRRFAAPSLDAGVAAIAMILLDVRIGCFLIVYNIALTFINIAFAKYMKGLSVKIQNNFSRITSNILDALTGFSVLKLFNVKGLLYDRFDRNNSDLAGLSVTRFKTLGILSSTNFFLMLISNLGMITAGTYLIKYGLTDLGSILGLINMQANLNRALLMSSEYLPIFQQSMASSGRIFELLDEKTEKSGTVKDLNYENAVYDILLENINFSYKDNDCVIKNMSMKAPKGKKVAIVGPSGCGKSTVLKLLMNFYETHSGNIFVRGIHISDYGLEQLRDQFAYVPQNPYLFDGTVEFNIMLGNMRAGRDEIINAARASYSHDFIMNMAEGYQSLVGEKGVKLSGGQKQRICIARALLRNAPILLLDEATSALDSESELEVQKALFNLMKDKTTIVIAHRLSTIRDADWVYVMNNGTIEEEGTHDDLLKKNGLYMKLNKSQIG